MAHVNKIKKDMIKSALTTLFLLLLNWQIFAQLPIQLTATNPSNNATAVTNTANISVTFDKEVNPTTLTTGGVVIHGGNGPVLDFPMPTVSGSTATFDPVRNFFPGEVVSISFTSGVTATDGGILETPFVSRFTTAVSPASPGVFANGQNRINSDAGNQGGTRSVHAADLDGDGDLDVLSASQNNGLIAWYENDGSGSFGTTQTITTAVFGAISVYAADLDGDGDLDVLSAAEGGGFIAWHENDGSGTFGAMQTITNGAPTASSVYAADLDGDGDLDVLSASEANGIAWYENDGSGSFGALQTITTEASGAKSVYAADLDGDGDLDVLSASQFDNRIAWCENDGSGSFGPLQTITTGASAAWSVYAADLDGDGDLDVLSASLVDDRIAWYENDGSGSFGSQQTITTSANDAFSVYAADLDGDGDLDVLSASQADARIAWYENDGSGSFGSQQTITTSANGAISVYAADLDGDGDLDVLSASEFDNQIAWYENALPISITCPANQNVNFNANCEFVIPDFSELVSVENNVSPTPTLVQSPIAGTVITTSQTVTFTVTDSNGNTDQCTFELIPADNTEPVISAVADQNVNCQFVLIDYTGLATATDNCTATPVITQSPVVGTVINTTQTVTLTATDDAGNTATTTFEVIPSDTNDPVISAVADQNVDFDTNCQFALIDYTGLATATDNCTATPVITQSPVVGTVITTTQTVTLTATDDSGNTATTTFEVIPADTSEPIISAVADQNVEFDANCQFTLLDYTGLATVTDNCTNTLVITQSPAVGTEITSSQTVTLMATDDAGNTATITFEVIIVDTTDPVISTVADQNVEFDANCQFTLLDYTGLATATDFCNTTPIITQSPAVGTVITTTQMVTLTATDDAGNTATTTFEVIPTDDTPPSVIARDITIQLDVNGQASIATSDIDNGSTDNCSLSLALDQTNFTCADIGTNIVTLTATDGSGNSSFATATVTVEDNIAPTVITRNITLPLDESGQASIIPEDIDNGSTDNCGIASLELDITTFNIPTTSSTVTLTVTDVNGNSSSGTAIVSFEMFGTDLFLPTLFTPNGDSNNDFFIVRGGGNVASIQMKIFDRENNLVYSSESLTELFQTGWDGGGQPQGAYLWGISGSFTDGSPLLVNGKNTGIIRLLR
ncbi:FG-GAP-like repeat-containing protein [Fulvivirga lutea]|uniref:VCBS repeat-containing protein n=1 Tax=Fulvivirga lutea TaxID=2810512 RepID=A0A974WI13_9BACT|nr:FG-GAP-like repeat-containing protein [Fulvivirga lutea]QSE98791.1 VCBS repeat-containing protein [Fulvivirga lutea]